MADKVTIYYWTGNTVGGGPLELVHDKPADWDTMPEKKKTAWAQRRIRDRHPGAVYQNFTD